MRPKTPEPEGEALEALTRLQSIADQRRQLEQDYRQAMLEARDQGATPSQIAKWAGVKLQTVSAFFNRPRQYKQQG